jgi:outer membrane protein assembly factor BamD
MNTIKFLNIIIILLFFISCAKEDKKILNIKKKSQELELIGVYKEGYEKLNENDPFAAANKFLEAELLFPQSKWAPQSALMASYSYYLQNYYAKALLNLNRYLKTYPNDENLPYAHYLIAMCHYEMIEDEKRDIKPLIEAKKNFIYILERYPNTDFALDSKFKLDLIQDILASKEMYLGRHYQKKNKWIPAINRFKHVIEEYDQTIFVEEALHRLVEINYKIGLMEESQKYANVLGYNYLSGKWYKKSYKVFNKNYKNITPKKIVKKKKGVIDKFKKLFD